MFPRFDLSVPVGLHEVSSYNMWIHDAAVNHIVDMRRSLFSG